MIVEADDGSQVVFREGRTQVRPVRQVYDQARQLLAALRHKAEIQQCGAELHKDDVYKLYPDHARDLELRNALAVWIEEQS